MDNNNLDDSIITLTDEDGNAVEFEFVTRFDFEEKLYYVLCPLADNEDGEYVILKLDGDEESDEAMLVTIDDDDEYDRVIGFFENEFESEIDYDADKE